MKMQVPSGASVSGLRIWHCHELWCGLQTWLRSLVAVAVAVAVAGSCSSDSTPSLGTSICHKSSPRNRKKTKKKKKKKSMALSSYRGSVETNLTSISEDSGSIPALTQ